MIIFESLALLRPYWLLTLPILILILRFTKSKDMLLGDWPRAIEAPLLSAILKRQQVSYEPSRNGALYWSIGLVALALSGPATKLTERNLFHNLEVTALLLDVSQAENLSRVVSAAQAILSESEARQIGLILFAGEAYLACPLTDDTSALEALIFAVDNKTVPEGGSRPDKALSLVRDLLREAQSFSGDIVLISDGAGLNSNAYELAATLSREGHKLHTLFISSGIDAKSSTNKSRANMQVLASSGAGIMKDSFTANEIVAAINRKGIGHITHDPRTALEWTDYGRYLLLCAALPLLLYCRRGAL